MNRPPYKWYRNRLFSPAGLYHLLRALGGTGINLMTLLHYAARSNPSGMALTDETGSLSYKALYQQSLELAGQLVQQHGLGPGNKTALLCHNHTGMVKALFAIAATGADLLLLNTDMGSAALETCCNQWQPELLIHDRSNALPAAALPLTTWQLPEMEAEDRYPDEAVPFHTRKTGKLHLLTGGTGSSMRTAARKPALYTYTLPLLALLKQLPLSTPSSVLIALPLHHGYGLATLLVALAVGAPAYLGRKPDAGKLAALIQAEQIAVIALVPLTLQRLLVQTEHRFPSLKTIITGGDLLPDVLAARVQAQWNNAALYNLYGTSETGLISIAGPADLQKKIASVGKPLKGITIRICDTAGKMLPAGSVGHILVRSPWSAGHPGKELIDTGDMGYTDRDGYLYLKGRSDDQIVSGGENVYPSDLERILLHHPGIAAVQVTSIPDTLYGKRLKAIVVSKTGYRLTAASIREWLQGKAARYQQPAVIEFRETLPYTAIGKPDRKKL